MKFEAFISSIMDTYPPAAMEPLLLALWYDAKGDWESSHNIVQDIDTAEAAHLHAYLHRKEGDSWNADYWYRKAGVKRPSTSLEEEWDSLVKQHSL